MRLPPVLDGLTFRVGLLLTLALVPLGLVALSLTRQISLESDSRERSALIALTAEAAAGEESFLRSGLTVAGALAAALPMVHDDPQACSDLFTQFVAAQPQFVFAGYVAPDATIVCGNLGVGEDISASSAWRAMQLNPAPRIDTASPGLISGQSVIVMSQPVFAADGSFRGHVSISVPDLQLLRNLRHRLIERSLSLVTFNADGRILFSDSSDKAQRVPVPGNLPLESLADDTRRTFVARTADGQQRIFAVVPIIEGAIFALGSWQLAPANESLAQRLASPVVVVLLTWVISLVVAYLAMHWLAIRNIADLRQRMRAFTESHRFRRNPAEDLWKPLEFREISRTWEDQAETMLREGAELENTLHDRTVLLKEVHHRVKNNLQLIASIVSMKVRKARSPEAQVALRDVQLRVMAISAVHQALYTTSTAGRIRADELLRGVVGKTIEAATQAREGIRVDLSFDPLSLYPDQAVPLALLASEAVTNALKYVGRPTAGEPWIRVSLQHHAAGEAVLEVANSTGAPMLATEQDRGTGLGVHLMTALASQLGGKIRIDPGASDRHVVQVRFQVGEFDERPRDGTLLVAAAPPAPSPPSGSAASRGP